MANWLPFFVFALLSGPISPQRPIAERIAFVLKNPENRYQSLYALSGRESHYFWMHPFEKKPQNWPVGTHLYRLHRSAAQKELLFVLQAPQAGTTILAQSTTRQQTNPAVATAAFIMVRLRNQSARVKHVVLLSYPPSQTQYGTYVFDLAPGSSRLRQFEVGTRLFRATASQEQQLMRGEPIADQSPFWVVGLTDQGKTISLPD